MQQSLKRRTYPLPLLRCRHEPFELRVGHRVAHQFGQQRPHCDRRLGSIVLHALHTTAPIDSSNKFPTAVARFFKPSEPESPRVSQYLIDRIFSNLARHRGFPQHSNHPFPVSL